MTNKTNNFALLILGVLISLTSFQCKSPYYFEFSHLPQSIYLQSISIMSLVLLLGQHFWRQKLEIRWFNAYIPIGLFIGWAFLSLLWCTNPSEGLTIGLNWLAAVILFFVITNLLHTESNVKTLMLCNLLPVVFIIVVGLSQVLELNWCSFYTQIVAPAVTFGNKNMMVDAFICLLPSTLLLSVLPFNNKWLQILGYILFGLGITLIVMSDTRAGMLALAMQILFLLGFAILFRKKFSWKQSITPLLVSLSVVLILAVTLIHLKNEKVRSTGIGQEISIKQLTDRVTSIIKTKEEDKWALKEGNQDHPTNTISDSRTMRIVTWKNTFAMFLDKPFTGFGLYNWQIHYGEYRNAILNDPVYRIGMVLNQVHNDYLQILVDLGLPGFILILTIFYFNFKSIIIVFKHGTEEAVKIVIIICISLIGLLVVSAFSFPFERAVPVMMYFVFTGILVWYGQFFAPKKCNIKTDLSKKTSLFLTALVIIGFLVQYYYQDRRLKADREFKSAHDQYALGNFKPALEHCQKTLELTPYRHMADLLLGYTYLNLNQFQLAEQNLLKGLNYYPNELISLLRISETYTRMTLSTIAKEKAQNKIVDELLEKTEYWFQKTLDIRSDVHSVYYSKGLLYSQKAKYLDKKNNPTEYEKCCKLAIENHLLALKNKPDFIDSIIEISRIYNENKEHKKAVQYAEKAVSQLLNNLEISEKELILMETNKVQKTSRAFLEMAKKRRINRQILIAVIDTPLQILKTYYGSIELNVEKYIEVLQAEEKYYLAKEVEVLEQEQYAKATYENSKSLYPADSKILSSIKKEYDERANEVKKFKLDKQLATIVLLINKGEAYQLIKQYDQAIKTLKLAISISREVSDDADKMHIIALIAFDKSARLCIADMLCIMSTVNNEGKQLDLEKFKEYSPQIQEHLELGIMTEAEAGYQKFMNIKKTFSQLKTEAEKIKPK